MTTPTLLEGFMLVCFGVSWPVSIIKTVKSKSVEGVSSTFYSLILIGYVSGTMCKYFFTPNDPVIYFYIINATMVFIQIVLYSFYASPKNSLVRRLFDFESRIKLKLILRQAMPVSYSLTSSHKIIRISMACVLLLVIWILVPSFSYGSQNNENQKTALILFKSLRIANSTSPEEVMRIVEKAGGRFLQSTTIKGYKADIYDMSGYNRDTPNAIAVYIRDDFRPQKLAEFTFLFNKSNAKSMKSRLCSLTKSKSDPNQIPQILVKENGEPDKRAGQEGATWKRDNGQSFIQLSDCSHSNLFKDDFTFSGLIEYRNTANYQTIEKNVSILNPVAQSTVLSPPVPTSENEITDVSN